MNSGGVDPLEIDSMMEVDLEVHHRETSEPIAALSTMADALPGLGIVAAVLGVVLTMGSLGGPKEALGEKVAAALVGTFLGILLCYGFFGPLAGAMTKNNDAEGQYMGFLRMAALAFRGLSFYDLRRWGWSYGSAKGGGRWGNNLIYNGKVYTNAYINYNYMDYWDVPADETVKNPPSASSAPVVNPNY